jgi:hypothetical protein
MSLTVATTQSRFSLIRFFETQTENKNRIKMGLKAMSNGVEWLQLVPQKIIPNLPKSSLKKASRAIKQIGSPLVTYAFVHSLYKFALKGGNLSRALKHRAQSGNNVSLLPQFKNTIMSGLKVAEKGTSFVEWLNRIHLINLTNCGKEMLLVLNGINCTTGLIIAGVECAQSIDKVRRVKEHDLSLEKTNKMKEEKKILYLKLARCIAAAILATCVAVSFFFDSWIPPLVLLSLSTTMLILRLFKYFSTKRQAHLSSSEFLLRKNLSRLG